MSGLAYERAVGRNIRAIRESRGLSLEAVADRCPSLSISALSRLERGGRSITVRDLHELAAAFGLEPADLLNVRVTAIGSPEWCAAVAG